MPLACISNLEKLLCLRQLHLFCTSQRLLKGRIPTIFTPGGCRGISIGGSGYCWEAVLPHPGHTQNTPGGNIGEMLWSFAETACRNSLLALRRRQKKAYSEGSGSLYMFQFYPFSEAGIAASTPLEEKHLHTCLQFGVTHSSSGGMLKGD